MSSSSFSNQSGPFESGRFYGFEDPKLLPPTLTASSAEEFHQQFDPYVDSSISSLKMMRVYVHAESPVMAASVVQKSAQQHHLNHMGMVDHILKDTLLQVPVNYSGLSAAVASYMLLRTLSTGAGVRQKAKEFVDTHELVSQGDKYQFLRTAPEKQERFSRIKTIGKHAITGAAVIGAYHFGQDLTIKEDVAVGVTGMLGVSSFSLASYQYLRKKYAWIYRR